MKREYAELIEDMLGGSEKALARLITLVEGEDVCTSAVMEMISPPKPLRLLDSIPIYIGSIKALRK
jgi:hypothetical protein